VGSGRKNKKGLRTILEHKVRDTSPTEDSWEPEINLEHAGDSTNIPPTIPKKGRHGKGTDERAKIIKFKYKTTNNRKSRQLRTPRGGPTGLETGKPLLAR
jgi:hypothetical protein